MRNEGPRRDLFCVQLVIFGLISRRGARRGTEEGRIFVPASSRQEDAEGEEGGEREDGKSGECPGKGRGSARVCTNFNLRRKSAGEILQTNFPARTGCLLRSLGRRESRCLAFPPSRFLF